MISTTISTYGLALSYANQGWFIIPLHYPIAGQCSCGNPNCGSAAKHPISQIVPKGYLNGTVNKELIKSWWEKYPEANIGVVVGPHSNICVLDVDPRNGGDISFGNLIRVRGDLPATVQCLTGGGGQHYYFVYNLLFGVPKEFKKGIDIKRSGYVVAPGSQHISGKYYEWMSDQALGEIAIASIPSFLEVSSISHTVKSGEPEGNSIEHLKKLSGKPEVRNQMFDFKSNINGTWQIIVDGKVTGCWIDSQGYIGSYDKGGPTVVQWLQWYGHTKLNAMVILKKYGIELRKLFGSEQMSDLRSIRPVIAAQKIKEDHQIIYSANRFFQYSNGYYGQCDDEQILRLIIVCLGEEIGKNKLLEIFDLLKIYAKCAEQQLNQSSYINFRNGLFNYDTWTISEHSPDLLFTSQLPVNYNPEAICPLWIKTLNEIFEQDQNKINVLQEFIGLCLTKIVKFEKSLILVGEGANGKSVVLSVIEAQMGDENYASVPLEKFDNHFYLAYLFGKTVNISTETNAKAEVYDSTFKSIVSGETLVVDEKHKKPFQYKPFCKLIFAMNNLPRVSDKTDAFFRRILILRLNRVFKKEEQNRNLKDQLAGEREGILSWSLVGLRRLLQRGYFAASAEIEQEVSQYKKENNSVAIFVEEECEVNNSHHVFKDEIYRRYSEFCRLNNYGSFAKNRFGKELIKVIPEIQDGKVTGSRAWYGIK